MNNNFILNRQPRTLQEAVDLLLAGVEDEDRPFIRENPPESAHFMFGMYLRNEWHLWETDTPLVQWFRTELGLGHADDMSGIILGSFWAAMRGETFDMQAEVRRYHEHWQRQGIDPVTQERIDDIPDVRPSRFYVVRIWRWFTGQEAWRRGPRIID